MSDQMEIPEGVDTSSKIIEWYVNNYTPANSNIVLLAAASVAKLELFLLKPGTKFSLDTILSAQQIADGTKKREEVLPTMHAMMSYWMEVCEEDTSTYDLDAQASWLADAVIDQEDDHLYEVLIRYEFHDFFREKAAEICIELVRSDRATKRMREKSQEEIEALGL